MHKYILIPDSFKGTLSARDFCAVAREAIGRADPGAQVLSIPLADGGEGTVEAFLAACGGQRIECPCTGPYGGTAPGFYGLLPDGTAVVELAAAAGLPLAGTDLHPAEATTYGVGQLLLHAARHGARRLLLGLGGSATNDGGCGAAAALGVEFYDRRGRTFVPTGGTLGDIHRICAENLEPLPPVTVLCDVDNPLCGPRGAAAVFGPQKGADPDMVRLLDAGLAHLAAVLRRDTGRDVLDMPGGQQACLVLLQVDGTDAADGRRVQPIFREHCLHRTHHRLGGDAPPAAYTYPQYARDKPQGAGEVCLCAPANENAQRATLPGKRTLRQGGGQRKLAAKGDILL